MMTKRAVPKAVHSIAQLARAVHGLESNPWRRILQQKGGHGRASHVVDGRRHDRVLRRRRSLPAAATSSPSGPCSSDSLADESSLRREAFGFDRGAWAPATVRASQGGCRRKSEGSGQVWLRVTSPLRAYTAARDFLTLYRCL